MATQVSCTIDLADAGQAARPARAAQDHEHGRLGEHVHPDRVGRERRRAERPRARRQPRRRVRGPGRRAPPDPGARAGAGLRARHDHPRALDRPRRKRTRGCGRRASTSTARFPARWDGPPDEQLADFLTRFLFPPADVVIDMHSGGRSAWFMPVLAHARRRRRRAAPRDARRHAGVELRLPLPLRRHQRHRPAAASRPSSRASS